MLRIFSGQRTKTLTICRMFIGIEEVVADSASCYQGTPEALLFRLHLLKKKVFYEKAKKEVLVESL